MGNETKTLDLGYVSLVMSDEGLKILGVSPTLG